MSCPICESGHGDGGWCSECLLELPLGEDVCKTAEWGAKRAREATAHDGRPIALGDVIDDGEVVGMVAWVGDEHARVVWQSGAETWESHDRVRAFRARWDARKPSPCT